MDHQEESSVYLKYLSDTPQNYLLQNSEDGLTDTLPVESIFTEINPDWPSEGFPVLLNGSSVAHDAKESGHNEINGVRLYRDDAEESTYDDSDSRTVTFYTNVEENKVSSNNLIFSKDILLQLENSQATKKCDDSNGQLKKIHIINGNTYSISYIPNIVTNDELAEEEDITRNNNVEVIQLLNIDGTVTNINKNVLNVDKTENTNQGVNIKKFEDFYCEIQAHKCKVCSFLCETVDEIKTHIKTEHEQELCQTTENITIVNDAVDNSNLIGAKMTSILNNNQKKYLMFLCSECGLGYSNKDDLKEHMMTQHSLVFVPNNDEKTVTTQNEKTDRIKLVENEKVKHSVRTLSTNLLKKQQKAIKKVKCSVKGCVLRFAKDELKKRHEECHVNQEKRQFECPTCKEKFSIWRICSMHMWKCHQIDLDLLTCPMCNEFKSNSAVRVINHMRIHYEEKPFICTSCGKGFKQATQLRNHEIIHQSPDKVPSWFSIKQCEVCERYFANSKSLKKHIKAVHDKFKPFICNICGHQTTRKAMLQLHYRQHTGDKPHKCSYCDYKTGDHNCLRRHMMRHFGASKYTCPYCPYTSIQTSCYKSHLTNKHPGKEGTYSCSICSYTTVNIASYLSHVKCHEIEKRNKRNMGKNDKNQEKNSNTEAQKNKSNHAGESTNSAEDDETQNCFINIEPCEETVDTGGITIPAGIDLPLVS